MSLTKITYNMIDHTLVNAKDFGVDTTGATDSSLQLQAALTACAGGKILKISGNILLDNQVVVPSTIGGIVGDGIGKTTITFTKEQSTNAFNSSAIVIDAVTGAFFKGFTIQYTGTFYVPGQSYFGCVNGLYIRDCDDILVEEVEATGFNEGGISFRANTRGSSNLCKRNRVSNCWLHHNRVAGCLVSWQEQFLFTDNYMAYNGHVNDGGTGYGIAMASGSMNKMVTVTDNITDHNYRKGYDVHDCESFIISNNISRGDRIYPISIENDSYPMNSGVVTDNIIEIDPSFYVTNDDDQPPGTYSFLVALAVYVNPYSSAGATASVPNFTITGNLIKNIGCDDNTHTITGIYFNCNASSTSIVEIANNQLRGTYLTNAIQVYRSAGNGKVIANIHDNNVRCGPINQYGIDVIFNNIGGTNNWGECWVENNYIDTPSSATGTMINIRDGGEFVRVNNNKINVSTLTNTPLQIQYTPGSQVWLSNNAITATTSSTGAIVAYGQNKIVESVGNTYNGALLTIPDYRNSFLGGSRNRIIVPLKDLSSGVATPLLWIAREYTISHYIVRWSAFYNGTGPNAVYLAGGIISFASGFSDNGQGVASTITTVADHSADNGPGTALSVTWAIDSSVTNPPFIQRLVATATANCTIYAEVEQISVMERTTYSLNQII